MAGSTSKDSIYSNVYSELAGFPGRDEALQGVQRYGMERYKPMFYRTNDLVHSRRVALLMQDASEELNSAYGGRMDVARAVTLSFVHDDPEIITGDAPAYHVERWLKEQVEEKKAAERQAISVLAGRWPRTVLGYSYEGLLREAQDKETLESQVMSFLDKMDGLGECLHEVHAGNRLFIKAALAYAERLTNYTITYPRLKEMVRPHPLLHLPIILQEKDMEELAAEGTLHTEESASRPTAFQERKRWRLYPLYERWKELTREHLGISLLVEVKEQPQAGLN